MKRYLKVQKSNERSISKHDSEQQNNGVTACKKESTVISEFYKKPWFWVCLTLIVYCITRPFSIIICGNSNDNENCGSHNASDLSKWPCLSGTKCCKKK